MQQGIAATVLYELFPKLSCTIIDEAVGSANGDDERLFEQLSAMNGQADEEEKRAQEVAPDPLPQDSPIQNSFEKQEVSSSSQDSSIQNPTLEKLKKEKLELELKIANSRKPALQIPQPRAASLQEFQQIQDDLSQSYRDHLSLLQQKLIEQENRLELLKEELRSYESKIYHANQSAKALEVSSQSQNNQSESSLIASSVLQDIQKNGLCLDQLRDRFEKKVDLNSFFQRPAAGLLSNLLSSLQGTPSPQPNTVPNYPHYPMHHYPMYLPYPYGYHSSYPPFGMHPPYYGQGPQAPSYCVNVDQQNQAQTGPSHPEVGKPLDPQPAKRGFRTSNCTGCSILLPWDPEGTKAINCPDCNTYNSVQHNPYFVTGSPFNQQPQIFHAGGPSHPEVKPLDPQPLDSRPPAKNFRTTKCSGCMILLQYPEGTKAIQCPNCNTVQHCIQQPPAPKPDITKPFGPAKGFRTMNCTSCSILIQYPEGTKAIKCPVCNAVMHVR